MNDILFMQSVLEIVILSIIYLISIGFHEYAHAYASYKLGDPTPKLQGRLTLNPLKHIDPIGFLMIFLIHFGWGKPVIVNPSYYKNPLRDELITALAGPFTNFLMAFIATFLYLIIHKYHLSNTMIDYFFYNFIIINIALFIFNLLPIYPLDGYRIVKFLKPEWGRFMEENALVFSLLFIILMFLPGNPISYIITGVGEKVLEFMIYVSNFIISLF